MKVASKLISELVDQILGKLVSYATMADMSTGNIVLLEEQLKEGIQQLSLEQQLKLTSRFISKNIIFSFIKTNNRRDKRIDELCHNILLFNTKDSIDAFLVSKFLVSFLLKEEKEESPIEAIKEEKIVANHDYNSSHTHQQEYINYHEDHRFGNQNKARLKLSEKEVTLLNKIWVRSTVFTEMQQAADESANLFLHFVKKMEELFEGQGKDFLKTLKKLDKKQRRKMHDEYYYNSWYTPVTTSVFEGLFKIAENAIRSNYRHTRKRDEEYVYEHFERDLGFNPKEYLMEVINAYQPNIEKPNAETLLKLNELNRARWKEDFKNIKEAAKELDQKEITQGIYRLFDENTNNASRAAIYFEATKVFINFDRLETLKCYLQYYALKKQDKKGNIKELPKSIAKKLFAKREYGERFVKIIARLSLDNRLDIALEEVATIFRVERKKIEIDDLEINKINETHKETVEQLNVILADGEEVVEPVVSNQIKPPSISEEKSLEDIFGSSEGYDDHTIDFDPTQRALLHLFKEQNMTLTNVELTDFAKEKRKLKGQLINIINDLFYEEYEEVLIEDTEEGYEINEDYIDWVKKI